MSNYYSPMFGAKKLLQRVESAETRLQSQRDDLRELAHAVRTMHEQMEAWELRMADLQEKAMYQLTRLAKRQRDAGLKGEPILEDTGDPVDRTTAKIHARRKGKHGLPGIPQR